MAHYQVIDKKNGTVIISKALIAKSFASRLVGLMFRARLASDEGLIFRYGASIHTCFMRFPIDIIFLDKNMRIVRLAQSLAPWRAVHCFGSYLTIELNAGIIERNGLLVSDTLEINPPLPSEDTPFLSF